MSRTYRTKYTTFAGCFPFEPGWKSNIGTRHSIADNRRGEVEYGALECEIIDREEYAGDGAKHWSDRDIEIERKCSHVTLLSDGRVVLGFRDVPSKLGKTLFHHAMRQGAKLHMNFELQLYIEEDL